MNATVSSLAAIVLGLVIVIGPVYMLTVTQGESPQKVPPQSFSNSFKENVKEVEGTYADKPTISQVDIEFFAITFIVALAAYLIIKRKMPDRKYTVSRFPS